MEQWKVTVECRVPGALGVFTDRVYQLREKDETAAREKAVSYAKAVGWETRFVKSAVRQ